MNPDLTIGPYATQYDMQSTRKILPYSLNKTASYVSNIFLGSGFHSPDHNAEDIMEELFEMSKMNRLYA